MADLRIVDAPEIPTENITGEEKLPTGGSGNYSISLDSLADYTKTKKDLVDNTTVDGKVNGVRQELDAHIEDFLNPHQVTKGQIGLGNVDNTADLDKPVSNSTQAAIISAVAPKAETVYVDNALSNLSTAANKFYPTLAEANADIANIAVNQPVTVGEVANGGLWYKATTGATTLTKSSYDPLTQANQYASELISSQTVISLAGLTSKTLSESEAANRVIYLSGNLAGDCTVSFPKTKGAWVVRHQATGGTIRLKTLDSIAVAEVVIRNGDVVYIVSDGINMLQVDSQKANLLSPSFTGTPTTPTPAATSSTQIANAQFVQRASHGAIYIDVSSGNTTLTADQALYKNIRFSGTLTSDIIVETPTVGEWIVSNGTTGGFTIKLKCPNQTSASPEIKNDGKNYGISAAGGVLKYTVSGDLSVPTPLAASAFQSANVQFVERASSGSVYVAVADIDTTLTVEQVAYQNIVFSGALTADRTIYFPKGSAFNTIRNTTTGGFAVILKCAGQVSASYPTILNDSNVYLVNATGGVMKYVLSPNSGGSGGGGTGVEYTIETKSATVEPMTGLKEITAMSRDGMTLFSNDSYRYLYESKDFGATWTELFNVGNGQVGRIEQLENGELFFTFTDSSTTPQTRRAYVTKGYGTATPTFEEVFSFQRDGVYFAKWSYDFYKNIILLTEYGVKYSPTQTEVASVWTKTVGANARYVYMSLDYGKTWKTIFDLNSVTDGVGVHMHAACYDPYWQRIWVHHGDGAFGRNGMYYSDDLGDTWTYALRTNTAGVNFGQAVETVVLEECILFGTDSAPNGITRIGRDQGKYPDVGYYQLEEAYKIPASLDILNYICFGIAHAKHIPKAPYIFGFAPENQPAKGTIVATYNGYDFFELWTDSTARSSGNGIINIQGVTIKNEVIATLKDGSGTNKKVTLKV